jgi:hypothetical protein
MRLEQLAEIPNHMLLCPVHKEPFRLTWPKGLILINQRFADWLLFRSNLPDKMHGEKEDITTMLKLKPWCCYITQAELLALYNDARLGSREVCDICKQLYRGTPYRLRTHTGKVRTLKHLCFVCLVYRATTDLRLEDDDGKDTNRSRACSPLLQY